MTDLLARIKATGEPIARLARRAEVSRGALSNVAHGRRTFSPATSARVLSVIEQAAAKREASEALRDLGALTLRAMGRAS